VVKDLVPHAKNPRTLSVKQKADLEASIIKFNLSEIPAVNIDGAILAGHQRIKILVALGRGEEEIDVRVPNRLLTAEECEEYMLRSNRNTGSWDYELLRAFDTSFLLNIGFDDTDLSNIWDDVLEIEDDDFKEEDAIEEAKDTDIKEGDRFQLGKHTLLCGNSMDPAVVKRVVGEEQIPFVYVDIPYNINLSYDKGISGKQSYGGDVDDKKSKPEYRAFVRALMENALSVSAPDSHHFWYHDAKYTGMMQSLFEELGIKYKRTVLWIKNGANMTPQIAFSRLMTCGLCGSGICAEDKYKKLAKGGTAHYIYYGCNRSRDLNCKCGYIREEELIKQLVEIIGKLELDEKLIHKKFMEEQVRIKKFQRQFYGIKSEKAESDYDPKKYAEYILTEGSIEEKRELLGYMKGRLVLKDKRVGLE